MYIELSIWVHHNIFCLRKNLFWRKIGLHVFHNLWPYSISLDVVLFLFRFLARSRCLSLIKQQKHKSSSPFESTTTNFVTYRISLCVLGCVHQIYCGERKWSAHNVKFMFYQRYTLRVCQIPTHNALNIETDSVTSTLVTYTLAKKGVCKHQMYCGALKWRARFVFLLFIQRQILRAFQKPKQKQNHTKTDWVRSTYVSNT